MNKTKEKASAPAAPGNTRGVSQSNEARQPVSQLEHDAGQNASPAEDKAVVRLSEEDELLVEVKNGLRLTVRGRMGQSGKTESELSGDAIRWMCNRKV